MSFREFLNETLLSDYKGIKNLKKVNFYSKDSKKGELVFTFLGAEENYISSVLKKLESMVDKNYTVHWYVDDPGEWGMMKTSNGMEIDVTFRVTKR